MPSLLYGSFQATSGAFGPRGRGAPAEAIEGVEDQPVGFEHVFELAGILPPARGFREAELMAVLDPDVVVAFHRSELSGWHINLLTAGSVVDAPGSVESGKFQSTRPRTTPRRLEAKPGTSRTTIASLCNLRLTSRTISTVSFPVAFPTTISTSRNQRKAVA